MRKVVISGGSGLVGSRMKEILEQRNYEVYTLSRKESNSSKKIIHWDPELSILNTKEIEGISYFINLAGAGIADKKWTNARKLEIKESRTKSIALLSKSISNLKEKPISFVTASAVGYYGLETTEKVYTESDSPGNDFLAETCIAWENEVDKIEAIGVPSSKIRIGIVLAKEGGALKEMARPIKLGFGAVLGNGEQYIPWIHIDDLCELFIYCMENELNTVFNAASPNQHNNKEFTKVLGKVLKKPLWLPPVPGIFIKLLMGERARLVLKGSRVDVTKVIENGFQFKFKKLEDALKNIYKN